MEAREGVTHVLRRVSAGVRGVANGDTEDVVQEAVARAIKSGVSLEAEQWLRTVAKRVAIDKHRRRRETPSGAPTDLERWAPATEPDPEDVVIRAERSQAVRDALAELPPRYRNALLAYAEEDSPAAVAKRLGLSATATWTLLSRARTRLRLQLEQVGFVPAMVFSGNRPRLRQLLAAGAVAATATTAAMIPSGPAVGPAEAPSAPPALAAGAAPAPEAEAGPSDAVADLLDVDGVEVPDAVDDIAAPKAPVETGVKVGTCLGPNDRELGVEVSVVEEQRSLITRLLERIPEPLRDPLSRTC